MTEAKMESVPHEVIDDQLLVALDDKSKVAIIASEEDLVFLISTLGALPRGFIAAFGSTWERRRRQWVANLRQLRDAAFGHKPAAEAKGDQ